ncbi:phosphoenolpyruvate protein [Coleophoma cylindrospora]|uniref:Phosphoenolpyruvate protein n=1 Tax=Coleophoma cylindrospora TaxID=1849047 RepID=A0A3D8QJL8_9HELO|nr:phosphoenolpyruvate protein [Coleophoma cylindrospora]
MTTPTAALATRLRALHIPGQPLILTNVYDAVTARAIADLPGTQALATASYAVAQAAGLTDETLTYEANLAAIRSVASVARTAHLPLTADWQDGYGPRLEEGIAQLLALGVVGINLEDTAGATQQLMDTAEATERVRRAVAAAQQLGVADFVVNARCDALLFGAGLDEVVQRGKAYLDAGATTVFVWGGGARGGISAEEVRVLVEAFEGRLNVSMKMAPGNLGVAQLRSMGVARISIGPALQGVGVRAFAEAAERVLSG